MSHEALSAFLLAYMWRVVTETPFNRKSGYYDRFFTSERVLLDIFSSFAMSYAPGLLEVLTAAAPPTVDWFKSLPNNRQYAWESDNWAVYLLVLEKDGSRTRCYVGSGTNGDTGLAHRWKTYDELQTDRLPSGVKRSIDEGFKIVHKGLLCWSRMPPAAKVPIRRLVFLALEAVFNYLFWCLQPNTHDDGMRYLCSWTPSEFGYDGICTHSSLVDHPAGDYNLTEEQLEAQAELAEKKFRLNKARNAHTYHEREMERNYDEYSTRAKARKTKSRLLNPELDRIAEKARNERIVAEKKWYCSTCDKAFTRDTILALHMASKEHATKVNGPKKTPWYCHLCNRYFCSSASLKRHRRENTVHKEKVKAAEAALKASS